MPTCINNYAFGVLAFPYPKNEVLKTSSWNCRPFTHVGLHTYVGLYRSLESLIHVS